MTSLRFVRAEKSHCDLLYHWANDPEVRANSFNTKPIQHEEHVEWFEKKLTSPMVVIFIVYLKATAIGQIRIDIEEKKGNISYTVDKKYRGLGYGTSILLQLPKELKKSYISLSELIGKVKYDNFGSQKAFEKAGYSKQIQNEYILYTQKIHTS